MENPVYQIENFCSKDDADHLINLYDEHEDKCFLFRNTFPIDTDKLDDTVLKSLLDKSLKFASQMYMTDLEFSNSELVKWPEQSFMLSHYDYQNDRVAAIVYLNDNYEGGETVFPNLDITPQTGNALFFDGSEIEHSVSRIKSGTRYTLSMWFNLVR